MDVNTEQFSVSGNVKPGVDPERNSDTERLEWREERALITPGFDHIPLTD